MLIQAFSKVKASSLICGKCPSIGFLLEIFQDVGYIYWSAVSTFAYRCRKKKHNASVIYNCSIFSYVSSFFFIFIMCPTFCFICATNVCLKIIICCFLLCSTI
ncbi:hypothetical protein PVAP13_9KG169213 [Panicum virgatum]|uniref:Uncharacterized protein n=1 Tax=Panicum virgatum TaxID=38727 RepID=A0A8T0NIR6_PANVG|nr:hypothetical protein PVAP13_9KG169213 [Panicum virgatum]